MSPEARAFLDSVRSAEDPTPADERRVLAAVRATVAFGLVTNTALGASKTATPVGFSGVLGIKVGVALLGVVAATALVSFAPSFLDRDRPTLHQPVAPSPGRAAVTEAPAPPTSAAVRANPAGTPAPSASEQGFARPAPNRVSLRDEIAVLSDVRAAIERGDGAAALQRLDEHVTDDRQLLAERSAARILALCSLGRSEEAGRAAAAFRREHPRSIQRTAVERSCAGKTNGER